ncbi:hypothetical protein HYH03_007667 [Edaphochlamys debaryana]|uniref:Uncharacterized protein n=1 Tax=Edaphochlamys debaryana TaxID=47281 RepID=A0A835YB53_9CHLO|nr:hypothetical protein HYH03_007667 [Edaphochlamys debaryana]|eukprot:KAG2494314.1 hypothetical protein HYH03_007667 [Edaphochlamys debaryana]
MAKRKRGPDGPLSDSPPDLHILVAGREEPLPAHRRVLSLFSGVVDGLPSNTDGSPTPWDLRGLVLEGESGPVASAVVERWLDAVYHFSRVDASRRPQLPSTLAEARPLLLLADAVGTAQGLMDSLGGALADRPDLALTVAVGDLKVDLQLKGRIHFITQGDLCYMTSRETAPAYGHVLVAKEAFQPHKAAFPSAVALELESWLHLAGRLNLVPLARALMGFVKAELTGSACSILHSTISTVISPRVFQFMPRELMFEAFARDMLMDRPAYINVMVPEVQVTATTPLAAAYFNMLVGSTAKGTAVLGKDARVLVGVEGAMALVTTTVGGLAPDVCAKLVKEAVAAALEDE